MGVPWSKKRGRSVPGEEIVPTRIRRYPPAWSIQAGVCVLLVASAVAPVAPAAAQSLQFDIDVEFPDYVILWYWDQITIDITATELTDHFFGQSAIDAGAQSTTASLVGNRLVTDAGINGVVDDDLLNDPSDLWWLIVPDAWALESVSASGFTEVSIKDRDKNADLPGPGGNRIRLTGQEVEAAGNIGETIVVPSTGVGVLLWGAIHLQIDITEANRAGDYEGIEIEIEVENI